MTQDRIEWCVKQVKTEDLQKALNEMEEDEFQIDKYERLADQFDGIYWIIVGFRAA